jgi:hypothetical protein
MADGQSKVCFKLAKPFPGLNPSINETSSAHRKR